MSEGLALRGWLILVTERDKEGKLGGKSMVLSYYRRKHTRASRSTFTAELHHIINECVQALIVRSMLVELEVAPSPAAKLP